VIRLGSFNIITDNIDSFLLLNSFILFFFFGCLQVIEVLLSLVVALVIFIVRFHFTLIAANLDTDLVLYVVSMDQLNLLGIGCKITFNKVQLVLVKFILLVITTIASATSLFTNRMMLSILIFILSDMLLRFLSVALVVGINLDRVSTIFI
jgi:hypothetical protein